MYRCFLLRVSFCIKTFLFAHYCNKKLLNYLDLIEVEHGQSAPYLVQSQEALEAFYQTRSAFKTYDSTKNNKNKKFGFGLNLYSFVNEYNWKRQHITTWKFSKHLMFNLNYQNLKNSAA